MNLTYCSTMNYEQITMNNANKNKPKQSQNKPKLQNAQMNVNSLITKDYRKNDAFAVQKNKPNSNPNKPKQSQSNPKQSQFQTKENPARLLPSGGAYLKSQMLTAVPLWENIGVCRYFVRPSSSTCCLIIARSSLSKGWNGSASPSEQIPMHDNAHLSPRR